MSQVCLKGGSKVSHGGCQGVPAELSQRCLKLGVKSGPENRLRAVSFTNVMKSRKSWDPREASEKVQSVSLVRQGDPSQNSHM